MNTKLLLMLLLSAGAVAGVHLMAIGYQLYFHIFWFDILAHFLGGVFIAIALGAALDIVGKPLTISRGILAALVAGILWEIFEYVSGFPTSVFMSYVADTAKDLLVDCLGGVVGVFLARMVK